MSWRLLITLCAKYVPLKGAFTWKAEANMPQPSSWEIVCSSLKYFVGGHDPAMDHLRCQLPCSSRPAAHFPVSMGLEKQNLDSKRVGLLSLEAGPQGHTLATSGRSAGSSTLPDRSYECSRHLTGCTSPCSKICTSPSQIGQTAALSWTKELLANTGH